MALAWHRPGSLDAVHWRERRAGDTWPTIAAAKRGTGRHPPRAVTVAAPGPFLPGAVPAYLWTHLLGGAADVVLDQAMLDGIDELVPPGTANNRPTTPG